MNKLNANHEPADCPLCENKECNFLFYVCDSQDANNKSIWNAVQCTNCKILFLNPWQITDKWIETIKKSNLYLSSTAYIKNALKRINKYHAGKILDIGCGHGEFLFQAKKLGWNVAGVELFPNANPHNIPIRYGFFENMDLPKKYFDIVTFWGVTEYLREPLKFFEKAKTVLKDDGHIIFVASNYRSIQRAIMQVHNFPRQQFIWSKSAFEFLFNKVGLEITSCDYKNDIRNGWCTEFLTFLFKQIILQKSRHQILREHNSGIKEKNLIILLVKAVDRIITMPLSIILSFLGFNGVMNITAKKTLLKCAE